MHGRGRLPHGVGLLPRWRQESRWSGKPGGEDTGTGHGEAEGAVDIALNAFKT